MFQQAATLNPSNVDTLRQVGRSLHLLGKHRQALEVWEEVGRLGGEESDWELWLSRGEAWARLGETGRALECFIRANRLQPHDVTYVRMGELQLQAGELAAAANTFLEALEWSPENPELLTSLGLAHLRMGDNQQALDQLGASLAYDPRSCRAILAAGSIIQDQQDLDAALVKYRVAAVQDPGSPQLWSNIGMCFFGKQRYIAAIACLKRALCLAPCDWVISYNLGLAHAHTGQFASAFHHLSCAVNLRPDFAPSYQLMALALSRLEDVENACAAYERAIALDPQDATTHANYAVLLLGQGELEAAHAQHTAAQQALGRMQQEEVDPDLVDQVKLLGQQLSAAAAAHAAGAVR